MIHCTIKIHTTHGVGINIDASSYHREILARLFDTAAIHTPILPDGIVEWDANRLFLASLMDVGDFKTKLLEAEARLIALLPNIKLLDNLSVSRPAKIVWYVGNGPIHYIDIERKEIICKTAPS